MDFLPKNKLGKWSLGFIISMPVLFFIASFLANSLYANVAAGNSIMEDMTVRPILALSILLGMFCGISAFVTGLKAIIKQKERAVLVYLAAAIGTLLILFLVGEILHPH